MERITYGRGHVFTIPLLSQADTKLFKTTPTLAAGDAKLKSKGQAFTNLTAKLRAFTSGGTSTIATGDVLTGATSGATGIVVGYVLMSGTFAGGDAAGSLFIEQQTGTFQSENLNNTTQGILNVLTIGGDFTVALMVDIGQGHVAVPLTSIESKTPDGQIAVMDVAGAEWCDSSILFETEDHPSAADSKGCVLEDPVGSATGQTTTNLRLSGDPGITLRTGMFFRVVSGTGVRQSGYIKTYTAGATFNITPYVALDTALDGTSVVKVYEDAKRVPAHIVATEDIGLSTTQKADVTAAVDVETDVLTALATMDAPETGLSYKGILRSLAIIFKSRARSLS